jgi:alkylation response protein AidB-like acyl-CoA dehydrogenase
MENIDTKQLDSEELVNRRLEELIDFRTDGQDLQEFWGKQFDLGLAWVQFPEGSGGLGLNPKYQMIITERLRSEGISQQNRIANILGVGMGAPDNNRVWYS